MTELDQLRRDNAVLAEYNTRLLRRAVHAEQAVEAFARGEVDAVASESSTTPVMLRVAQEQVRESRQLLRAIFDGALDAIVLADDDGTFLDANPAASKLFGLRHVELLGCRIADFMPYPGGGLADFAELRTRGYMVGVFPIRLRDGTTRTLEHRAVANVMPGKHLSILRDVSDRVAADAELRASRDALEEAQSIARLGSWSADIRGGEITWSNECYRIFGLPVGTPMSRAVFLGCLHAADVERVTAMPELLANGQPLELEYRVQWPDGTIRWVLARMMTEPATNGPPTRMRGTIQDVTERHAAIEALQASETRYRRIIENTSEGVWMYDAHDITTFMNGRMAQMLGCSVEEAVGQSIHMFVDESRQAAIRQRTANRRRGVSDNSDLWLRRRDGSELWASIQASSLFDAEGRFEAVVALLRDVGAERRADDARAHLAAIVESSEDAILGIDLDGVITSWNLGAEHLYQYRADEMVGRSAFELQPPSTSSSGRRSLDQTGGTYTCERRRKDGSLVEVAVTLSPVRDATGKIIGVSSIGRDLTARRKAEEELHRTEDQLRHAQKMEAVGRLAGGIAHDFNNLLSVILSYSEFAIEDLKPGDPLRDDMIQIDQAGKQAASLTRQLLAFSRQQVLQPRVVDLHQIILPMERMLRRVLGEDIALTVVETRRSGQVLVDPGQIEQVVMNLAVNARDAMPEGGSLTIETSDVRVAAEVNAHTVVPPGDYVRISIADTGCGMDAATCARIFEPFFTTKEIGKGTGLGLSTVLGIVQQSGGYVEASSELGRGTTFEVYLPRTDQVPAVTTTRTDIPVVRGTETILLVEDEEQVRIVACSILRRNGYTVLETSNGGEAFLISKDYQHAIDLLLTDVVMPRMSGRKLADELALQRPAMKVLYASGYTDAIIHHGVLAAGTSFVQKPFTPDLLLRKVREVLSP